MLDKIEEKDLEGKGVYGQETVPGLSAQQMQEKIEEIVRQIAIPKINEIIEYLLTKGATQEDLERLLVEAGSVTSVFGRAGAVKAQKGDYTADMVGAAAEKHARDHMQDGEDPIMPHEIGAADRTHEHGNITANGRIGTENGKVLMTGLNGVVEAKAREEAGFVVPAASADIAGEFTAENNRAYFGSGITDFVFNCDEDKTAKCHGWVTFAIPGKIELKGFDFVDDPDEIAEATAESRWEFDLEYGCLIIRKRSE